MPDGWQKSDLHEAQRWPVSFAVIMMWSLYHLLACESDKSKLKVRLVNFP